MSRPRTTHRGLTPETRGEWVHYQSRMVDRAVDLLCGLVEEHGAELAFSRRSPEHALVANLLGLARDAGGGVALDALRHRLRARLADDLGREELGTVMADLGLRIADVGGGA